MLPAHSDNLLLSAVQQLQIQEKLVLLLRNTIRQEVFNGQKQQVHVVIQHNTGLYSLTKIKMFMLRVLLKEMQILDLIILHLQAILISLSPNTIQTETFNGLNTQEELMKILPME